MISTFMSIDTTNCTMRDLVLVLTRPASIGTILDGEFVSIQGIVREDGSGDKFIIKWTDGHFTKGSTFVRVK